MDNERGWGRGGRERLGRGRTPLVLRRERVIKRNGEI